MTGDPSVSTPPQTGARREVLFAGLAILSVLIGISRIENPLPAPLWMKALDVLIATAFFGDWVYRIHGASTRWRYALTHSYEILFFIPFTLLAVGGGDIIRGGRLLRLLRFARYARYTRLGLSISRLPRRLRRIQRVADNAQLVAILVTGALVVSFGAVGLLLSEGDHTNADTYAESLWWSLSLFTTVGYDIPDPATPTGRVVSGILMVAGVAYVGIFTASLAGAILRTPEEE